MTFVYHHTDSARLPWILHDQALKPGANRVGNFPDDFLWATPEPMGDRTSSSGAQREAYVDGRTAAVRFTLDDDDFMPWAEMKEVHPLWGARHIWQLERSAELMGVSSAQVAQWRCRIAQLSSDRWIRIEFRTWRNPCWRLPQPMAVRKQGDALGVELDGALYFSRQLTHIDRATAYEIGRPIPVASE